MKHLLLSASLVLASTLGAHAQDANANSASQSGVIANIQGAAGAVSNNTFTSPSDTTTEVRNVPAVTAPGVVTAHNCLQGYSGGISAVGGGIALGGTVVDKNCERISQAAALNTLVGADAAVLHMAGIPEVCKTLRAAGRIGAGSNCGEADNRRPVFRDAEPTVAARNAPALIYTKCEVDPNGAIRVGVRKGDDRATAIAQCRAALNK